MGFSKLTDRGAVTFTIAEVRRLHQERFFHATKALRTDHCATCWLIQEVERLQAKLAATRRDPPHDPAR